MISRGVVLPVLLLGTDGVCLAAARSLAARGIAVEAATSSRSPLSFSAAVKAVHHLPDFHATPEYFLDCLLILLGKRRYELVIPAGDTALVAVSRFYQPIRESAPVSCPPPEILSRVLCTAHTLRIARECGIPIPWTRTLAEATESAGREELPFPLRAKPAGVVGDRPLPARWLENRRDLEDLAYDEQDLDTVLVQAPAPGDAVGVDAIVREGEPLVLLQHRRHVSRGGDEFANVAVSEPPDEPLWEYSTRLLKALEWQGPASVEFRHDRVSGRSVLTGVCGRLAGSLPLARKAGVDLPYHCVQVARGERPAVLGGYPPGVRARWAGDAVWSARDPGPSVYRLMNRAASGAWNGIAGGVGRMLPRGVVETVGTFQELRGVTSRLYLGARAESALHRVRRRARPLPAGVTSVLFLCHGNIIRSALAEALLKRELAGVSIRIASAGVGARNGRPPDERACAVARDLGVTLDDHRARIVSAEMLAETDVVIAMDELNQAFLLDRYPQAKGKLRFLGEWRAEGGCRAIEDPYRRSMADVRRCALDIQACVAELAAALRERCGAAAAVAAGAAARK